MVQFINRTFQDESEDAHERILESVFSLALNRQEELRDAPTIATTAAIESALSILPKSLPSRGLGDEKAYELVQRHLLPALALGQSGPRFFGLVIGGSLPSAQVGDFLATIYDQNAGMNGGPSYSVHPAIEHRALLMLLELLELPAERFTGRTLTSGSTAANLLGLACGREIAVRNVLGEDYSVAEEGYGGVKIVVFSDRAHCSLHKGAATIGIGRKNFVQLGDTMEEIEEQLKTCGPGTGRGAIVTLSYGEVNTGEFSVDIEGVRALCDKYNVWLHVDGAFGSFARLSPSLKHLAPKLELADSVTCDGHKWLNVPYECGIFFSRSAELQSSIFGYSPSAEFPAYLNLWKPSEVSLKSPGVQEILSIPQPHTLGLESSKRFRAFPLYCSLLSLGAAGYRDIIERNVQFARDLAWWMSRGDGKDWYEVLNLFEPVKNRITGEEEMNVPLNIILFRAKETCPAIQFRPSSPHSGRELLHAINADREVFVTPGPNGTLRVAVSNWMTGLGVNKDGLTDLEIVIKTLTKIMVA